MLLGSGGARAAAARLRRDRAARAARAARARSGCGGCTRGRSRVRPRCSPTASTRRTQLRATGCESLGESTRVEFVPFGVDERGVRAGRRRSRSSTSSRSARTRTATSSCCSRSRRRLPGTSFRVVTTPDRARALGRLPVRTSTSRPISRSTRCGDRLERGACRRAARSRQQLLGRDDGPAAGDGAREAGRRVTHGGDRRRLRARRRRELPSRPSRATRTAFAARVAGVLRRRWHARALGARARETVEAALTWDRYVDRLEAVPCSRRGCARLACRPVDARALSSIALLVRRAGRGWLDGVAARRPDSTARPRGAGRADLALFHDFAPPPSGGGHQFLRALVAGARAPRARRSRRTGSPAGTPACLFNSFNFDFARLRRFAREDCRLVHRVDGPIGVYRGFDDGTDARIADDQRRARGRDGVPVALQPREAPRARDRAARAGRHPERGRPGDLPSAGRRDAARRPAGSRGRDELVGQPAQGRRRRSRGSTETLDPARFELTFVGQAAQARSSRSATSARSTRRRRASCSASTTSTSRRAATTRARTRCSRRSRAGCRPPISRQRRPPGARRRGRAAVSSRRRSCPTCSIAWPPSSTSVARAISRPVDRLGRGQLLEVLGLADERDLRIAAPWRTTCDARITCRALPPRPPARSRCGRARARRPLRVGRLDGGDVARRAGAQESARPLGLPGDHGRDEARSSSSRPGRTAAAARSSSRRSATSSGAGEVVSIDVEPEREDYPAHPRITYLGGRSSTDPDVRRRGRVRAPREADPRHPRLGSLAGRTSRPSSRRTRRSSRSAATSSSRTRTSGRSARTCMPGPFEAIETFLATTDEFEIDREREKFLITFNPSGYLRRVR